VSRETFGDSYIEADFSALDKLVENLGKKHYVDVGILGENAGKTDEGGATIGMIGAVQEFGKLDGKIPKRSFILMPLQTHQSEIQKQVEPRMQKHMETGDIKGIFTDIGIAAEGVIQDAFDTRGFGTWKSNAESTIEQKGSDSPNIDKGLLRKSISSKVGQA
jgi:hypothetical protein